MLVNRSISVLRKRWSKSGFNGDVGSGAPGGGSSSSNFLP